MASGEWKPNKKQALFLSIPLSIKEAFYGGGAGSGKTDVLLMYALVHKWHKNPLFKQLLLRRTLKQLKKEVVPRSRDIYPKFGANLNESDMVWTFPRDDQFGTGLGKGTNNKGAQIWLGHCEYEKDVVQYDSMQISLFSPDELTSLTEYMYLYICFERNRSPRDSGLPSITRAAGMPGGVGHTFTKKRFIDPAPEGSKIIIGKGGNKRIYIHATLADNPHIDPTYAQSLEARPEAEKKARKYGAWAAYLGLVFDELRTKKYPDEPENAIHTIEPFQIPDYWPKFVVGDWGYTAMTYIGFYAVSPQHRIYQYRELSFLKTKINEWAPAVKYLIDQEKPRIIKFCKSAGHETGQENTIQEQISEALGCVVELTDNSPGSRVAGKMLLHEYLRWKPKPLPPQDTNIVYDQEYAMRLYRLKGEDAYKLYLKQFDAPEEETNLPKLMFFCCNEADHTEHPNCCPLVLETIKACSYDKPRNNKPAEDVAEFEGDDPYDTTRYALDIADNYFRDAESEFKKAKQQDDFIRRVQLDGDFTAFYRNMRNLESMEKIKPITRYHNVTRH